TRVKSFKLDVRDRVKYEEVVSAVERDLGPIALLFNNAGVAATASVDEMSFELWDWAIGINLFGVVNGIQLVLPRMLARREPAHIVNTSSGAGLAATGGGYLYPTAKFAVVGLSESLRLLLADRNIGVSVLCPGPVATSVLENTAKLFPPARDTGAST